MNDYDEDDISQLEDRPEERESTSIISEGIPAVKIESIAPDTPVYRLKLPYSHETFPAIFRGNPLEKDTMVIVTTRYGKDLAKVTGTVKCKHDATEIALIERLAIKEDMDRAAYNKSLEKDTFRICKEKIEKHQLEMKLIKVHYLLEEAKILFFFTADNRVDFRELVKDLVAVFRMRIELRQIGVRDEARFISGLGICGRGYCCNTISDKLKPVSIKMAKEQNLSFNSMKISGHCGRLLCCLSYECNFYSEQAKRYPQEGSRISYDNATWTVIEVNLITGKVKMSTSDDRTVILTGDSFERIDNRWVVKGVKI